MSTHANRETRQDAGTMGMYLLVVALGMLFAASALVYLLVRHAHQPWPPPDMPTLPRSLWLSTLVILMASGTIQGSLNSARRREASAMKRGLMFTLALGMAFLGLQTYAWFKIYEQLTAAPGMYLKLFYVLTGLHAAHVLGGLGPLVVVTRHALSGSYRHGDYAPVRYSAIYWHFLDAVWCVLFIVIYLL